MPRDAHPCILSLSKCGEEDWWSCGEDFIPYVPDGAGGWTPDPEELAHRAAHPEEFGTGGDEGDPPVASRAARGTGPQT